MTPTVPAVRLGFGCASLGSRVSAARGLAALAAAHDAGVTWFDLAPSYGDGEAETAFARFAKGRRQSLTICTKAGIAPGKVPLVLRAARPVARAVIAHAPNLRRMIAGARPAARRMELDAGLIVASLEVSLVRLGIEAVDVLSLHDPAPEDVVRDDVIRALEAVVSSGKARCVGVAGNAAAALAAISARVPVTVLQSAGGPDAEAFQQIRRASDGQALLVSHSILSSPAVLRLKAAPRDARSRALRQLAQFGYEEGTFEEALSSAALDYALQQNPQGVVLVSMFSAAHRTANLNAARNAGKRDAAGLFAALDDGLRAGA